MASDPSAATEHPPSALPVGTRLGEFELTRVLGVGGFGIVYLAFDHALHREVAVKEYMPVSLAGRTETLHVSLRSQSDADTFALGLRSFVNEARLLARFDHPSLVKVHRFWEANGTAYMAMPVYRGQTLKQVRAGMSPPGRPKGEYRSAQHEGTPVSAPGRPQALIPEPFKGEGTPVGAAPDEAWLRAMLLPLLGAINKLHGEGVYHRDIAPDNIQIEADGRPVLLDFGAARQVLSDKSQALTAILKPAYAPIEQYGEAGSVRQGPWTDLYALGATLHFMLLGRPPPPATARALHDDLQPLADQALAGCGADFLRTIDWMLAPRPADRPQSVAALLDVLEGRVAPPQRLVQPAAPPAAWEPTQALAPAHSAHRPSVASVKDIEGTVIRPPKTAAARAAAEPPPVAAQPSAAAVAGRSMGGPVAAAVAVLLLAAAGGWWWSGPDRTVIEAPAGTAAPAAAAPTAVEPPPATPAVAAMPPALPTPVPGASPANAAAPALAVLPAEVPRSPATVAVASRPAAAPNKLSAAKPAPAAPAPIAVARPVEPTSATPPAAAPTPAVVADPKVAKVLGPKESCGSRQLLALWNCIERQCRKAELRQHPDCVELRTEQERRSNPTQ